MIIFIFFAHVSLLVEKFSIYITTACALCSFLFSYNNTHIFFYMTIYTFFLITCFVYLYFSFLAFSYIFPSKQRIRFLCLRMIWYNIMAVRYRSKWWSIFSILCIMMHVLQQSSYGFVLSTTLSLYLERCFE